MDPLPVAGAWTALPAMAPVPGLGALPINGFLWKGPEPMLVDTGATVVALTANDAAMMGVDWNPGDVRPVARGASGDVYGVPVTLDRIDVGGIEARRVPAVVVPEGLDISLLGQSFLSKVKRVEVTGDEMVLHD